MSQVSWGAGPGMSVHEEMELLERDLVAALEKKNALCIALEHVLSALEDGAAHLAHEIATKALEG